MSHKWRLESNDPSLDLALRRGTRFLLGNGHLGYRGTFEEYGKEQCPCFLIQGVYDGLPAKWREPVNLPNPLFLRAFVNGKEETLRTDIPLSHRLTLDLETASLRRETEFSSYSLASERFLSWADDEYLAERITITPKDKTILVRYGADTNVYDINGPHFMAEKSVEPSKTSVVCQTNEGKTLSLEVSYRTDTVPVVNEGHYEIATFSPLTIEIVARVNEGEPTKGELPTFDWLYERHKKEAVRRWNLANVEIEGNEDTDFALRYSIFQLLMVADPLRQRGISARGVSGQTYKGASFWDSEMFLLPFYALTLPEVAKNLILYRVNTLEGAKKKASSLGYKGAFYAWESQEDGIERCSAFNVTDPVTNKPLRTYFDTKQIHINAAIILAISRYIETTKDLSIVAEVKDVIRECLSFYMSRAQKGEDGFFHFLDVVGPDEYHERVDDDFYTNYVIWKSFEKGTVLDSENGKAYEDFKGLIYLPKPNGEEIVEQFVGYFGKEDICPPDLGKRMEHENEYWGIKAKETKVIKQADVVAALALFPGLLSPKERLANYLYYEPYTEHGSSLSSSMHALLASELGMEDEAYRMFFKSATADLRDGGKEFAGGIYIGGTHVASAGGAYMSLVYGLLGLKIDKVGFSLHPRLPKNIESVKTRLTVKGKSYDVLVRKGLEPIIKEAKHD